MSEIELTLEQKFSLQSFTTQVNEMTKEQLKLQKRAGILTESEYKAKLEKISKPLNESIGGVISLGIIGDVKDPIDLWLLMALNFSTLSKEFFILYMLNDLVGDGQSF